MNKFSALSAPISLRLLPLLLLGVSLPAAAQVGVGTTSPHAKAQLDVQSATNNRGLLIPRLSSTQRRAILTPPQGLLVFQTGTATVAADSVGFWYATGTANGSGVGKWLYLPDKSNGDNLGNHTATQALNLQANSLTGTSAVNMGSNISLGDREVYLRGINGNDGNHGLGWYGAGKLFNGVNVDGPALYGYAGGLLGTNQGGTRLTALYWNNAGNVGIGTTAPSTRLRGLTGTGTRMVVAATDGTLGSQAVPALASATFDAGGTLSVATNGPATVTTTGAAWLAGGNTLSAGSSLGTLSNHSVDLVSNNVVRGRLTNLGEFFIGTTSTSLAGDLLGAVGTATFPWALNGYTIRNGAAVYGLRQAGAVGTWGSIHGETDATIGANNSSVSGISATTHRGVVGQKPAGGTGWGGLFLNDLGYTGFMGVASDRRVKTNIAPITGALGSLLKLQGSTYQYAAPYAAFLGGESLQYGFIAQELEAVFPDMVRAKSFTPSPSRQEKADLPAIDIKAISTVSLIPVLVEGIKEQQQLISAQQQQLETQQRRLAELEARLRALEQR